MAKFEKLTQEHIDQFDKYVDIGIKIGHDTTPINFEKAKEAVKLVYEMGKLTPPKNENIIYARSQVEAIILINVFKCTGKEYNELTQKEIGDIYEDLYKNNGLFFESTFFDGQHDSYITAFYSFFREVLGLEEETDDLVPFMELTKECGWCYLYEDLAIICDRYRELHLDEAGKLHNPDGPAYRYADGFSGYYWHGHKVPKWIIENKEELTPEKIFREQNKELQRCMMDIYGRDKIIKEAGKLVGSDDWGDLYQIPSILDAFGKPLCFVKVINFSPNETAVLSKSEIDEIILKVQKEIGNNGMWRHGDVLLKSKNAQEIDRKTVEKKNKLFRSRVKQECELLFKRKQVQGVIEYKDYFLQVPYETKTAYEAVKSTFRDIGDFMPFIAT
jgi:hypothetical protein